MADGTAEFHDPDCLRLSPLAAGLLAVAGVESVFLSGDFVSVTKEAAQDWDKLKINVLAALMEHFTTGQPAVTDEFIARRSGQEGEETDEIIGQIKDLLQTHIRPAVAKDGGDIVFDRFEDGVVYLHMRGACAGCPASTMTLKMGVERLLQRYLPEVKEVRPAQG